jgi:hypothetical protein
MRRKVSFLRKVSVFRQNEINTVMFPGGNAAGAWR